MYTYPERDPYETGLCSMLLIFALDDLGVSRRVSLMLSQEQALATLGATVRDRYVDALIRKAVSRA